MHPSPEPSEGGPSIVDRSLVLQEEGIEAPLSSGITSSSAPLAPGRRVPRGSGASQLQVVVMQLKVVMLLRLFVLLVMVAAAAAVVVLLLLQLLLTRRKSPDAVRDACVRTGHLLATR